LNEKLPHLSCALDPKTFNQTYHEHTQERCTLSPRDDEALGLFLQFSIFQKLIFSPQIKAVFLEVLGMIKFNECIVRKLFVSKIKFLTSVI
jgi:hypothetical protein